MSAQSGSGRGRATRLRCLYEPGLDEVVRKARGRNLFFSTDIDAAIPGIRTSSSFRSTPRPRLSAKGRAGRPTCNCWEKVARQILRVADSPKIVVEKSTLPVKTARTMEQILNANGKRFEVISNPEFLAEGDGHRRSAPPRPRPGRFARGTPEGLGPGRGGRHLHQLDPEGTDPHQQRLERGAVQAGGQRLPGPAHLFDQQHLGPVREDRRRRRRGGARHRDGRPDRRGSSTPTSASADHVLKGYPEPGLHISESYGLEEVARFWESVLAINEYQEARFVRTMIREMFNTIVGEADRPLRLRLQGRHERHARVPAIHVARKLLEERASTAVSDPRRSRTRRSISRGSRGWTSSRILMKPPAGYAIAIMTEWEMYRGARLGEDHATPRWKNRRFCSMGATCSTTPGFTESALRLPAEGGAEHF